METTLVSLLAVAAAIIGALVSALVTAITSRRNSKPIPNPPDPDSAKSGDMATSYWMREFDRLHDGMRMMNEGMKEVVEKLGSIEKKLTE